MRKNTGFTLVEVLVAVALTGIILLTGYSAFQKIMQSQSRLGAAIDVQKNLFYTNEKMAALIRDGGTIDYEEYFNRRRLGYTRTLRADGIFTFTDYSHFGNGNVASKPPIYYCGVSTSTGEECLAANVVFDSTSTPYTSATKTTIPITGTPSGAVGHQSYGQYAALALNYLDPVGFPMPIKLPPIFEDHATNADVLIFDRIQNKVISQNTRNVGFPELYLIKKNIDNSYTRTYFRHIYVQDPFTIGTITCNPTKTKIDDPADNMDGCLGKIQMTKLQGCDTVGTADGIIDAWIPQCDFNAINPSPSCSDLINYASTYCPDTAAKIYYSALENDITLPAPQTKNLKWVDVTAPEMNVIRATFLPNPLKIPALMSGAGDPAQSPSVSVYLEVQLSTKLRNKSFVRTNMNYPRTLITTYDLSE